MPETCSRTYADVSIVHDSDASTTGAKPPDEAVTFTWSITT